jgi:hypothetical protein
MFEITPSPALRFLQLFALPLDQWTEEREQLAEEIVRGWTVEDYREFASFR